MGYQVIVGRDVQDGELGLFFEGGGQLSENFAIANDLVRRKDEDGNPAGGMFEPSRRVKTIKLRGEISDGFWCPLSYLSFAALRGHTWTDLHEGDELDTYNGVEICRKYVTPATVSMKGKGGKLMAKRRENEMFHKQVDYQQFARFSRKIPECSLVICTEKLHGTSFRYGHVLDEEPIERCFLMRCVAKLLGWPETRKVWKHLIGTRNTILQHEGGDDFYGGTFREKAVRGIRLHKGEIIYGEIVGYTDSGATIMPSHSAASCDESFRDKFSDTVTYKYGCKPGCHDVYVYRIAHVNEDGVLTEMPWLHVVNRCKQLGLKAVPAMFISLAPELNDEAIAGHPAARGTFLETVVHALTNDLPSIVDESHVSEGVVVRWENGSGTGWAKAKSPSFRLMEDVSRGKGEADPEDAS
jgi:hypothetical protein